MKEVTEFYCHECNGYIKIELDYSINGNHVVNCPKCGHEHCRVIENGKVTDDRWGQRNRNVVNYTATMASYSGTSMYTSSTAGTTTSTASSYATMALTDAWGQTSYSQGGTGYTMT